MQEDQLRDLRADKSQLERDLQVSLSLSSEKAQTCHQKAGTHKLGTALRPPFAPSLLVCQALKSESTQQKKLSSLSEEHWANEKLHMESAYTLEISDLKAQLESMRSTADIVDVSPLSCGTAVPNGSPNSLGPPTCRCTPHLTGTRLPCSAGLSLMTAGQE